VVHYREQKGNFKTLDDVKKVPGIDAVKIESKRDLVEF
jgi:DNA uptake protein ComE-like DNA-binding protein